MDDKQWVPGCMPEDSWHVTMRGEHPGHHSSWSVHWGGPSYDCLRQTPFQMTNLLRHLIYLKSVSLRHWETDRSVSFRSHLVSQGGFHTRRTEDSLISNKWRNKLHWSISFRIFIHRPFILFTLATKNGVSTVDLTKYDGVETECYASVLTGSARSANFKKQKKLIAPYKRSIESFKQIDFCTSKTRLGRRNELSRQFEVFTCSSFINIHTLWCKPYAAKIGSLDTIHSSRKNWPTEEAAMNPRGLSWMRSGRNNDRTSWRWHMLIFITGVSPLAQNLVLASMLPYYWLNWLRKGVDMALPPPPSVSPFRTDLLAGQVRTTVLLHHIDHAGVFYGHLIRTALIGPGCVPLQQLGFAYPELCLVDERRGTLT